jgi:16S rRNA pseudouridine516 synthase
MERLDKILSNLGYCTRKQAQGFLRDFDVTKDGVRLTDSSCKVDSRNILIDNEPLDHPDGIFVLLNKPLGYVCSHDIGDGRLVYELFPDQWLSRNPVPSTIGRLDKDTTGVILVTDNTKLIHVFTSPKRNIDKVYQVTVDKPLTHELITLFASGTLQLVSDPKPCLPAPMKIIDDTHAELILHEGRYHQVKRMFLHCGYIVKSLHRSHFGQYTVEDLAVGEWKDLPMPKTV